MNTIKKSLVDFNKVSLPDLDRVTLMNRTDRKFCIHISQIPSLLEELLPNYSVLEIHGESIFNYDNTYFDTDKNQMYLDHQNERGNRYKIRLRQYVQTQINFLEVKFKTNKGRTIKQRIVRNDFNPVFDQKELDFLRKFSPFNGSELKPQIRSKFNRITMVNNEFTERITIDMFPGFENNKKEITLEKLVIIEVKQSNDNKSAKIKDILKVMRIPEQSFSKYCIGRSLLDENIKKNNFKPLLMKINKKFY